MIQTTQILAVRGFIVRPEDDGYKTLLLKRRTKAKNNPGLYECPGGKLEPGETLEEGLLRELQEETGCMGTILEPTPLHRYEYIIKNGKHEGRHYLGKVFPAQLDGDVILSREHSCFQWVDVGEILMRSDCTHYTIGAAKSFLNRPLVF